MGPPADSPPQNVSRHPVGAAPWGRPLTVDHDARRTRRLGTPPHRVSPCEASFFPSDGKETKGSPGESRGRLTAPVGPPPDPRLRGIPLHLSAEVPARKVWFPALVPSGPLGPDAVQNSGLCHFTAAPGSDQPWQRVRDRRCAGRSRFHEPGTGRPVSRPYGGRGNIPRQKTGGRV